MGRQTFILSFYFLLCSMGLLFSQSELMLDPGMVLFHTKNPTILASVAATPILLPLDQKYQAPCDFEGSIYFCRKADRSVILKI